MDDKEIELAVKTTRMTNIRNGYTFGLAISLLSMNLCVWIWLFTKEIIFVVGIFVFLFVSAVIPALARNEEK